MMRRRLLLQAMVGAITLFCTAVVALPSLILGLSPAIKRRPATRWRPLGRLDAFAPGQTVQALVRLPQEQDATTSPLDVQAVYVWRPTAEEVVVFSRSCTDLGCPVKFDAGSRCFYCPCHGGIFAQDGERMAGPPNRALHRYATRIRSGMVEIDLRSVPPMV